MTGIALPLLTWLATGGVGVIGGLVAVRLAARRLRASRPLNQPAKKDLVAA